jgi:hypothetical protein
MGAPDNSEWLEHLLAAEAKPYPYKRFHGVLSKDSLFLRTLTLTTTVVMFLAFMWALSYLDFIPGFSEEAQKFVTWTHTKYVWCWTMLQDAYRMLSNTDFF